MAGEAMEIKINDEDLLNGLGAMLARGDDLSPAMKNIGEVMTNSVRCSPHARG
jgi:hypothetical protein